MTALEYFLDVASWRAGQSLSGEILFQVGSSAHLDVLTIGGFPVAQGENARLLWALVPRETTTSRPITTI